MKFSVALLLCLSAFAADRINNVSPVRLVTVDDIRYAVEVWVPKPVAGDLHPEANRRGKVPMSTHVKVWSITEFTAGQGLRGVEIGPRFEVSCATDCRDVALSVFVKRAIQLASKPPIWAPSK